VSGSRTAVRAVVVGRRSRRARAQRRPVFRTLQQHLSLRVAAAAATVADAEPAQHQPEAAGREGGAVVRLPGTSSPGSLAWAATAWTISCSSGARVQRSSGRRRSIISRSRITRSSRLQFTVGRCSGGRRRWSSRGHWSGWRAPGGDGLLDDVDGRPPLRRPSQRRRPVERLAADPGDGRHHRGRVPCSSSSLTRCAPAAD
jgi:hypothetical protein